MQYYKNSKTKKYKHMFDLIWYITFKLQLYKYCFACKCTICNASAFVYIQISTHRSVEFHSQNRIGVTVVAYFCSFPKVAYRERTRRFKTNDRHQTAAK